MYGSSVIVLAEGVTDFGSVTCNSRMDFKGVSLYEGERRERVSALGLGEYKTEGQKEMMRKVGRTIWVINGWMEGGKREGGVLSGCREGGGMYVCGGGRAGGMYVHVYM